MPNITYVGAPFVGKGENLRYAQRNCKPGEATKLVLDRQGVLTFKYTPPARKRVTYDLFTVSGTMRDEVKRRAIDIADAIVFVVDSRPHRQEANLAVVRDVAVALLARGFGPATFPAVMQYNWRDAADAVPVEELEKTLNVFQAPHVEAVASEGTGVLETCAAFAKLFAKRR